MNQMGNSSESGGPVSAIDRWTELAILARQGDSAALEQLLRDLWPWFWAVSKSVLHHCEEAEEVAQQASVKSWQALAEFDPGRAKFRTFARRIVLNEAISALRTKRGSQSLGGVDVGSLRDDPATAAEVHEEAERVRRALEQISPIEKEAIVLRYEQGMKYKQAAQHLGVPLGTVASRVHRGKKALKKLLENEGDERRTAA